jgi:hypothetical protein
MNQDDGGVPLKVGLAFFLFSLLFPLDSLAAKISQHFDVIFIEGYIEKGDSERFQKALAEGAKTIYLTSKGGAAFEALRLGEKIAESKLPIVIWDYCASACANIIIPSSRNVTVHRNGAVIAFHAGETGFMLNFLEKVRNQQPSDLKHEAQYREARQALETGLLKIKSDTSFLHAQAGVKEWFSTALHALTSRRLEGVLMDYEKSRMYPINESKAPCDWWVPDYEGMRQAGFNIGYFSRPSKEKIAKLLGVDVKRIAWEPLSEKTTIDSETKCQAE